MQILVTGANGQLGNALRIVADQSPHRFLFTDITQVPEVDTQPLDLTDAEAVSRFLAQHPVDVVVNCAALTHERDAEAHPERAEQVNAEAPRLLAQLMQQRGGLLVHLSCHQVFGTPASPAPCTEEQTPAPSTRIGHTKLRGEAHVRAAGGKHIILRTGWLYSEFGSNLCRHYLDLLRTASALRIPQHQVGSPTYALDLAKAIHCILQDYDAQHTAPTYSNTGTYHYANTGLCSRFDFVHQLAQYAHATQVHLQPQCTHTPAPGTSLATDKFSRTFHHAIPHWSESLWFCVRNLTDPW